jgi:hypothetical protein
VRVEREAAHHEPGPEQARADREQRDLEQAALDEEVLERLEHNSK